MGGILIIMSILVSLILWADLKNNFIWISILSCLSFGFIGFYDDYLKVKSNSSNGLKARTRIIIQLLISFLVVYLIQNNLPLNFNQSISFPFFKDLIIDFGILYFLKLLPLGL